MIRFRLAIPVTVLLLSVSTPLAAQSLVEKGENDGPPPVALHFPQIQPQSPVIVVRPDLSDEQLGDLYMARKEYREASQVFKKLTDQSPQNPIYLNKLGIALHQQAALGLAMKYYERATKADPNYADAQNNIGTIWYQRKKYGKAIRAYKKAIAIRSDMPVLYSNLAYAYFGDRKYEEAIVAFRQALPVDPQFFERPRYKSGSGLQDRSVGDLAKSYAEAGNLERCLIYLRKAKDEGYKEMNAIKTDPSFAAVLKDPAIQEVLAPKPDNSAQP